MRYFNNGDGNGSLTRAELADGFRTQDILNNQGNMLDRLCTIGSTMQTGFGDLKYDNLNNVFGLSNAITAGFNGVNSAIADSRYAAQDCCCKTNNAITALSGENYRNTCDIINAIRTDGEATRALINSNTMQELRDKLADKDRALMTSELFSAQQAQTQNLVNTLRPVASPAYLVSSPYTSLSNGYCVGGCGCGA